MASRVLVGYDTGKGAAVDERVRWRATYRLARVGALVVACLIPVQAAVFVLSPPPRTVQDYFVVFARNPLLGMVDLDLLLVVDYLAMIPLYLALYLLVRRTAPTAAALGLVLGLFSLVLFLVSRDGTFSMWSLASQHAATDDPAQRAALVAAGQYLLTLYNGGTFAVSYVLGAASTLLYSWPMWRGRVLGPATGLVGTVTGFTMLVPANAGTVGMAMAMLSLIPTAIWLVLVARGLTREIRAGDPSVGSA